MFNSHQRTAALLGPAPRKGKRGEMGLLLSSSLKMCSHREQQRVSYYCDSNQLLSKKSILGLKKWHLRFFRSSVPSTHNASTVCNPSFRKCSALFLLLQALPIHALKWASIHTHIYKQVIYIHDSYNKTGVESLARNFPLLLKVKYARVLSLLRQDIVLLFSLPPFLQKVLNKNQLKDTNLPASSFLFSLGPPPTGWHHPQLGGIFPTWKLPH